jgi:hypothetical protein
MKILKFLTITLVASSLLMACKKDGSDTTPTSVRMTDAPGNYQQVNVDVTGVEFTMNTNAVINLNVKPGIYDLIKLTNGIDVLIATADLPAGKLSQVRLILGTNNSVKVDNVIYPLATPSAMQSGLKINVKADLVAGVAYELLLDFDANESIVVSGAGDYKLKPVLRSIETATTGSISGSVVTSASLPASVRAYDGVNVFTTTTDVNGNFLLRGVSAGTYTVVVTPSSVFTAKSYSNVIVTVGNVKAIGSINF